MRKVWVVVANSVEARIFEAKDVKTLVEIKTLLHSESRLSERDLNSDRPGSTSDRTGFARRAMEEQTPTKVKERNHFAAQIAAVLEEGFNAKRFERLYVIAAAPFIGNLRKSISQNVAKLIESEVQKDVTHFRPAELREYLPPVL